MNKHLIWAITLIIIVLSICGTLIWLNYNSWTIRFEMDDNTNDAIKSIEWDEINNQETKCYEKKIVTERLFDAKENTILLHGSTYEEDIVEVDCSKFTLPKSSEGEKE